MRLFAEEEERNAGSRQMKQGSISMGKQARFCMPQKPSPISPHSRPVHSRKGGSASELVEDEAKVMMGFDDAEEDRPKGSTQAMQGRFCVGRQVRF